MARHLRNRSLSDDPFAIMMRPPPDETPQAKQARLEQEAQAKERSERIDEQIKRDREAMQQAQPYQRKLLLLGQAESGKTTTLKQFQLMQSASAFSAQRNSYRALIYLNVLNSVRRILDAIALPDDPTENALSDSSSSSSFSSSSYGDYRNRQYPPHLATLALRLRPLLHIHSLLEKQLQGPLTDSPAQPTPQSSAPRWLRRTGSAMSSGDEHSEVTVHAWSSWSERFAPGARSSTAESITMDWNSRDDPGRIFTACAEDLLTLWEDQTVRRALAKQRPRIRESPGFFMDDLARITARGYMPTEDDILRARIKTVGVQEHRLKFERGPDSGLEWRICGFLVGWLAWKLTLAIVDVGGARNQRLRWAAYFQDVNAIIFLAPISPFDQTLAEDHRMNRVKDSLLLWQEICRNKVLEKVPIVLFLNKIDLLKAKLAAGVQFRKYMTSYQGPNESAPVAEFLRLKFDEVYRASCSPGKRTLYIHQTSVVDSRTTQKIIGNVREQIMRDALAAVGLY
ncbi:G-protein alpha subunit [Ceratobasidium sp. AG-Ba]|nr:G-protein alpha subunit [Ceratobasidium sp. AG-Ba]